MNKNSFYFGIISTFFYSENINAMSSDDDSLTSSKKIKSITTHYGPSLEDVPFKKPKSIGSLGDRSNVKYDKSRDMYYQDSNSSKFPKSPPQERAH